MKINEVFYNYFLHLTQDAPETPLASSEDTPKASAPLPQSPDPHATLSRQTDSTPGSQPWLRQEQDVSKWLRGEDDVSRWVPSDQVRAHYSTGRDSCMLEAQTYMYIGKHVNWRKKTLKE